jgi:hypothetical protein
VGFKGVAALYERRTAVTDRRYRMRAARPAPLVEV